MRRVTAPRRIATCSVRSPPTTIAHEPNDPISKAMAGEAGLGNIGTACSTCESSADDQTSRASGAASLGSSAKVQPPARDERGAGAFEQLATRHRHRGRYLRCGCLPRRRRGHTVAGIASQQLPSQPGPPARRDPRISCGIAPVADSYPVAHVTPSRLAARRYRRRAPPSGPAGAHQPLRDSPPARARVAVKGIVPRHCRGWGGAARSRPKRRAQG